MDHQPVLRKKRGISPIWILPLLAVALCGWLLYRSYQEAGIDIVVYFDDATGITPGKTQVMAMGIPFGTVTGMHPVIEQRKVKVDITMDRATEPYLVEDAKFWIVKPEVSATRITGLDTIVSGSYIGVQRGKSNTPSRTFMGLSKAPPLPSDLPGLHIKLRSTALRSIQEGSSIYFRNIKIGVVKTYSLQEDESVLIECFIEPDYQHLIRSGSRFYDASGFTISGKIPDIKVRMESVSSLFIGGIVVGTPPALQETPPAKNGDTFVLYENFEAADYGIPMTLTLASGEGISEGSTKVMYRGLEAGYVKRVTINSDPRRSVTAQILLDPRAEIILRENTRFWLVKPEFSLDGVQNLNTLLTGPYITFQPGDGPFQDHFELLAEPPAKSPLRPGRSFVLVSGEKPVSGSGAPIYYRKKKIGEVIGSEFAEARDNVETTIFIYDEYADLINPHTVFINSGGLSIAAGLSGFSFHVPPLVSALKGGIDVLRPPRTASKGETPARAGSTFVLYDDYQSALAEVRELMPEGLYITLEVRDLGSIQLGSPILYKHFKVGSIIDLDLLEDEDRVQLSCFIEARYQHLVSSSSRFYQASGIRVQGGLSGVSIETESLLALVAGGIGFYTEPGGESVKNLHRFTVFESGESARDAGNLMITVSFPDTEDLAQGAPVIFRGIVIGTVSNISFGDDLQHVVVTLGIDPGYETFFRTDTKIWVTTPKIGLNEVKNLKNYIVGPSIAIQPGAGEPRTTFDGLDEPPPPFLETQNGLHLVLEASHLGSLAIGSPVYYRQVKVGEVGGYDLAYDFKGVLIHIVIDRRYTPIIRENTRFWNVSGISVKGGILSGISLSTESLQAIIAGGIALATPENGAMGKAVKSGYHFILHEKEEEGWRDWSPDIFAIEGEQPPQFR